MTSTTLSSLSFSLGGGAVQTIHNIEISTADDANTVALRLAAQYAVPDHLRNSLAQAVQDQIVALRQAALDARDDSFVTAEHRDMANRSLNQWSAMFQKEHMSYAVEEKPDSSISPSLRELQEDDDLFPIMYHELIHSPALNTLLQLERTSGVQISEMVEQKDRALQKLQKKQMAEMDAMVGSLAGGGASDKDINELATAHIESMQQMEQNLVSNLKQMKNMQRFDYREYVKGVYKDLQAGSLPSFILATPRKGTPPPRDSAASLASSFSTPAPAPPPSAPASARASTSSESGWSVFKRRQDKDKEAATPAREEEAKVPPRRLEESFTVHLGTQKKTMHNLRLLSSSLASFLTPASLTTAPSSASSSSQGMMSSSEMDSQAERLATALSLYSDKLSAVVLLVDTRISSYSGVKRELARICEKSTEFHFEDLDKQLEQLQEDLKATITREGEAQGKPAIFDSHHQFELNVGDFYITKHSNLAHTHVVFNLVVDNEVTKDSLNTRHSAVIGLRNVLRCAFQNNIEHLTIPLLLVHELTEEMNPRWCLKRAELILKCMKGFIMENSAFGDTKSRTIQFVVPDTIDEELFDAFTATLSSVFRVSSAITF